MRKIIRLMFYVMAVAALCGESRASDWPNWRGPNHDGISTEKGWSAQWPAEGPKQLWKASAGKGFSGIAVADGRVYTLGQNATNMDMVSCLDAETGKELWHFTYPCATDAHFYEGGTSTTPTVDGKHVYTLSKDGDLFCFDAEKGTIEWSNNLVALTDAPRPEWGFGGSPVVSGKMLLLDCGAAGTALDKTSGKLLWTTGTNNAAGRSSPVLFTYEDKSAMALTVATRLVVTATENGGKLCSFAYPKPSDLYNADAIVSGDEVFISAGYSLGGTVVRLTGGEAERVWHKREMSNHANSCVLLDGCLYGIDGQADGGAKTMLRCLDFATGDVRWTFSGLGGGALIAADHKLIVISDKGELVVGEATPAEFKPISRAQVLGGKCWTAPALANGRIYCRNWKGDLVCLDVRGK